PAWRAPTGGCSGRPRGGLLREGAVGDVRAAAEQRDGFAALARDDHVVHAGAPPAVALAGERGEAGAGFGRTEEVDGCAGGDGHLAVGVAGEGERGVGEREEVAAVADVMAVHHVRPDFHRGAYLAGCED